MKEDKYFQGEEVVTAFKSRDMETANILGIDVSLLSGNQSQQPTGPESDVQASTSEVTSEEALDMFVHISQLSDARDVAMMLVACFGEEPTRDVLDRLGLTGPLRPLTQREIDYQHPDYSYRVIENVEDDQRSVDPIEVARSVHAIIEKGKGVIRKRREHD